MKKLIIIVCIFIYTQSVFANKFTSFLRRVTSGNTTKKVQRSSLEEETRSVSFMGYIPEDTNSKALETPDFANDPPLIARSRSDIARDSLQSSSRKSASLVANRDASTIELNALQYNYFSEKFIESVVASNSRYVLVGTGWSESSLGKMNINNQEKQKRAFALSFAQMMRIQNLGGHGRLIYLTTSPINPHYRRYLYGVANRPRLEALPIEQFEKHYSSFERQFISIAYLTPKGRDKMDPNKTRYLRSRANAYRQIKLPKALNKLRRDRYHHSHIVGLTAHFSGPYLEKIADDWDLPYLANPSAEAHWIKKSKSRQSFRDAKVPHPRGTYEPAFSVAALVDDIYNLLQEIPGRKIILKLDESAAGYGNRVMKFDDITDRMSKKSAKAAIKTRFNDKEIFPNIFIDRIVEDNGGAIIEEFIDCQNYASPASIYMINGVGDVEIIYTYDQLLGGKDNMVFQGSLGPINVGTNEDGDINKMSWQVGNYLSTIGVRGNVGTDFVTCDKGRKGKERVAYAIENNVRMTGTSYPYYTARTIVGAERMRPKYMKSFDDVKIPKIGSRAMRDAITKDFYLDFLLNHKLSLDVEKVFGCLVHNDTFRLGKIGLTCIGDNSEIVVGLYDVFSRKIYKYLDNHEITKEYKRIQEENHPNEAEEEEQHEIEILEQGQRDEILEQGAS